MEPADPQADEGSAREFLFARFPTMTPISRPPTLITINGCGLTIYGERDADPHTGTYVKTQCLAFLFVPILWLGAYRVADGGEGWYFVGREPLSRFTRAWNVLVLAAVLTLITTAWWGARTSSPEYKAAQALAQARAAEARGDVPAATRLYCSLAAGPRRDEGRAALAALLSKVAATGTLAQAREVVGQVQASRYAGSRLVDAALVDALARRCQDERAADPRGALALGRALEAVDEAAWAALREPLLEAVAAKERDPQVASELARIYEERDELERAEALLAPLVETLGTTDGARILGQALARRGDLEGANRLLLPWLEARLGQLHEAEKAFEETMQRAQDGAIAALNAGRAGQAWYARYEAASPPAQEQMVFAWVQQHMKDDATLTAARARLDEVGDVVPVALELGTVKLQRAQGLEGQARTDELLDAERVFLAVRGVAEDSPMFKLGLGQVYYWLGREADGRRLFDELLAAERSPEALLAVGRVLREVGDHTGCRALVDEAYEAQQDERQKQSIAGFRAILTFDMDERITWLERSDATDAGVQANLAQARAMKAMEGGDRVEAARHLRVAVDLYRKMPESATSLNNGALALQLLYNVAGERRDFDAYVDMLVKAERLEQDDSIVKQNLVRALMGRAYLRAAARARLDLPALRLEPASWCLHWLFLDSAGRAAVIDAVLADEDLLAAAQRLSALRVLAPKEPTNYESSAALLLLRRDRDGLAALVRALEAAGLDQADEADDVQRLVLDPEPGEVEAQRRRLEASEAMRAGLGDATPATRALHLDCVVFARLGLSALGAQVDPDATVELAEEAHALAPSHGTRGALIGALLSRAAERALRAPAFAGMRKRVGRALSMHALVTAALMGPDAGLREALAGDADVRRAAALTLEQATRLPEDVSASDWALVQAVDPAAGERLAGLVRADEVGRLSRRASLILEPASPSSVLAAMWERQANGDREGADALRAEAARRGVPLPF